MQRPRPVEDIVAEAAEDGEIGLEDIPESFKQRFRLSNSQRRVPMHRRNKFTNRFIPKVKPVGRLDNLSPKTVVLASSDEGGYSVVWRYSLQ